MGRFVVRDEPVFVDDVVSFNGIGITEAYMERAEIDIKALNEYHRSEIEEKYVTNGYSKRHFKEKLSNYSHFCSHGITSL